MAKARFPLAEVYGLLEPGPVILLSTRQYGRDNAMALSWHTMLEFEPPLVGCVVSHRDFSFTALQTSGQCVLNIPGAELASQVVGCGNTSGADSDKFALFKLTAAPAESVDAPLIAECFAHLECQVVDTQLVERYNFFVLEVVRAWRDTGDALPRTLHHRGKGSFMVAGETITLPSKMK